MFTSSLIQRAYQLTENSNTKDELRYKKNLEELIDFHKGNKGKDFLIPLNFYLSKLENTQFVLFPYLTPSEQDKVLRDLQVTYLLLLAELKYEIDHQKKENNSKYLAQLKTCQDLIDNINYQKACKELNVKPSPEYHHINANRPVAYMGLVAGRIFGEQMVEITSGSATKNIKDVMGAVNEKRLYWVWASVFLKTTLSLLPADFFSVDQAKATVSKPDPYTGTMSWSLYYFRFALNLSLLLKHTIAGPWMSQVEKDEGWTERFKTQWAQRKFALLNDSIWATGNLLCFFWLYGKGAAGTWGDLLTIALLVFDISLAVWDYEEQRTLYNQQINDFVTALEELDKQKEQVSIKSKKADEELHQLNSELAEAQSNKKTQDVKKLMVLVQEKKEEQEQLKRQLIELDLQASALNRAKEKCAREWKYQKIALATNISYAVGLMLAFVLLTAPFLPLAATTIATMGIAGAVLCFTFSVINNAIKGGMEIHKSRMTLKELRLEQEEKINAFIELSKGCELDDNARRLKYLEIKILRVESEYQETVITLQAMHLMRTILIESMIPPLIFLSLIFLPLGPGIGIIAAGLALAITTHILINFLFKKEMQKVEKLDEKDYEDFCANPEGWDKKSNNSIAFFKSAERPPVHAAKKEDNDEQALLLGHGDPATP